ncbi:2'-5' RNA ligase family protein [Sphaerisporangium sp. NPDC004334]
MYTWHVTFDGQTALHEVVGRYQAALPMLGVDLIPERWLHLTMQGVGFTDEVDRSDVDQIITAARGRLKAMRPVSFTSGSPIVDPEAIMFRAEPADELRQVRNEVREAIADVWGHDNVPDAPEWTPHVSIAYSNSEGPAAPLLEALACVPAAPASVTVSAVQLIRLDRDAKMYQWETVASVPLGQ